MNNPWVHLAKYSVIAVIWTGVILFGIVLAQTTMLGSNSDSNGMAIVAFISAAISTGLILSQKSEGGANEEQQSAADASKRKNDQHSLDPVSLLTDEDIAELRQDVKDNFRRRLLEGEADMTSFEALLGDREQRKRR